MCVQRLAKKTCGMSKCWFDAHYSGLTSFWSHEENTYMYIHACIPPVLYIVTFLSFKF